MGFLLTWLASMTDLWWYDPASHQITRNWRFESATVKKMEHSDFRETTIGSSPTTITDWWFGT
jgi:hypothetical protein